ncbi:MAG: hypothetical protein JW803_04295 [Endomicrobiales bacterium]|nr:hypothetical protein [Endomicrobiales bacterium]
MRSVIKAALFICVMCVYTGSHAAEKIDGSTCYVRGRTSEYVVLVDSPGQKVEAGFVKGGDKVTKVSESSGWSALFFKGWIKAKNTTQTESNDATYVVVSKEQELLSKPSSIFSLPVVRVAKSAKIKIIETKGDWLNVEFLGWARNDNISKTPPKPIDMIKWTWGRSGNSIQIEGIVRNNTEQTHRLMTLTISAKDENGNSLGSGSGKIGRQYFKPGEQASFVVFIDGAVPETDSISIDYTWESVETDMESDKRSNN